MNKWRLSLFLLSFLSLAVSLSDGTAQSTPPKVDAGDSTFALVSREVGTWNWAYTCTAVAIAQQDAKTLLLTASHCIFPQRVYAIAPDRSAEWLAEAMIESVAVQADLAVISVRQLLPVTAIGVSPQVGDVVTAVGWPRGSSKMLYYGFVSGYTTEPGVNILTVYMPGLEPGLSGSGLFCKGQQAICGVVVGLYNASPAFGAAEPISKYRDAEWLSRK